MSRTNYDAIVIGAGVLGAAVAASIARRGCSVLILERGEPAQGASGGNLGQISIIDRSEPWHLNLARQALEYYETELSREFDMGYCRSGGSLALTSQAQVERAESLIAELEGQGVECRLYRGADMKLAEPNLSPEAAMALLHCPLEGKLNPLATVLALLETAARRGAVLLRRTPVTGLTVRNGRVTQVQTPAGNFSAGWVVNCAGPRAAFLGELAGVRVPVLYHKGTAFVSQPVAPTIRGPICGGGFIMGDDFGEQPQRQIGFATVQTLDGTILIAQSTELCPADDRSVNMPSLALVAQRFLSFFPTLADLQIVRAWAAVTTYTMDGRPVFGFSEGLSNFFTAAGFKGAFTVAPAVGERVAEALEGRADPALAAFGPDR